MPLPPHALPEAKVRADRLYRNLTDAWGHLTGAAHGGPATAENLYIGTEAASSNLTSVSMELSQFRPLLTQWGALANYRIEFVNDVAFWSVNLLPEIRQTVNACGRTGRPPPAVALDLIRETLNYVCDIYNFGLYAKLLPYRGR